MTPRQQEDYEFILTAEQPFIPVLRDENNSRINGTILTNKRVVYKINIFDLVDMGGLLPENIQKFEYNSIQHLVQDGWYVD